MNKMILGFLLLAGVSTQAAQVPVFNCTVPGKPSTVTLEVAVSDNESVDYVTVTLNDKGAINLFTQMEKGGAQKQVAAGNLGTLVFGEQISQGDDGVLRDSGILSLSQDAGKWNGLLSAKGSVYPLECTKL